MSAPRLVLVGLLLSASVALAQADGGLQLEPRAVNPGTADQPGALIRDSGLRAEVTASEEAPAEPKQPALEAGPPVAPAQPPERLPVATQGLNTGVWRVRAPGEAPWNLSAALGASVRASYQGASRLQLDSTGTSAEVAPLMTRIRVAPELHMKGFGVIGEADTATGAILGTPAVAVVGDRTPYPALSALELRKLYLEYQWQSGAFRVGQQTSQWGLGLLANDGAKDAAAGDFGQAQFGSLVYRALLAVRPAFQLGGQWKALETAVAADLVVRDSFGEFSKGDRAFQGVLAVRFARDNEHQLGVYAVYRSQRNELVTDGGKATDAFVFDLSGKWEFLKRDDRALKLGFELVSVSGRTTQARNENADVLKVRELGGALKASYRLRNASFLFDWGYASGDQNPQDDRLESFRFDRDYKVGLVLFDQVLAYQSARSSVRASDPGLVGVPPEGADLIGTGGGVTGAWYLFPRVKVDVVEWLDVYGGPLFAFSTAKLTDPFTTRLGGGTALNSLGAAPGRYLGTELDLGVQARFKPVSPLALTLTGEAGVLFPGDAFALPDGGLMGAVGFGRVRLSLAL